MELGADISGWQPGNVDLSGMVFVYVKATQGTSKVNANHDAQVAEARADGLVVGHYHFPAWGDPRAEAQAFVTASDWRPGEFMVLDIENSPQTPWPADPVPWCVAFENEVARLLGIWCMDYAGPNVRAMWNWAPLAALGGGLIDPEYNNVGPSSPAPWVTVAMWQNADTNISGGDSDVFYGDRAALSAYGTPGAVTLSGTITPIQEDLVPNPTDPVFVSKDGAKVSLQDILNSIDAKVEAAGVTATDALHEATNAKNNAADAAGRVSFAYANLPAAVLNQGFALADGTKTNLAGILAQIDAKPSSGGQATPLAALSATDLTALAKAVNDEADARARQRLAQ